MQDFIIRAMHVLVCGMDSAPGPRTVPAPSPLID